MGKGRRVHARGRDASGHARRKFTDLGPASPEVTLPVLHFIQRIYQIEKQTRLTEAPPACRELIRCARSLPVADELHRFILGQYTPSTSGRKSATASARECSRLTPTLWKT